MSKRSILVLIILLAAIVFASCKSRPSTSHDAEVKAVTSSYSLSKYLAAYEDKSGSLGFEQIVAGDYFKDAPAGNETLNFGYSKSVFWLKGFLKNGSDEKKSVYLLLKEAPVESVTLFYNGIRYDKGHLSTTTNDELIPTIGTVFRIVLPPSSGLPLYIRVKSRTSVNLTFDLFDELSFYRYNTRNLIFQVVCFGLILFVLFYNLIIFIYLKEKSYLVSLVFMFFVVFNRFIVFGYLDYFFNTAEQGLDYYLLLFANFSVSFFMNLFNMAFLNVKKDDKIVYYTHSGLALVSFVTLLLIPVNSQLADQVSVLLILISLIMSMISGIYSSFQGYVAARYYIVATMTPIVISSYFFLGVFHIIPLAGSMEGAVLFTVTLMAVILTIALADRIATMQKETIKAQELAIESERVLNFQLEQKVNERTNELNLEKEKLEATNTVILHEIELARKIQRQLIPFEPPLLSIGTVYKPMMEVGGDFFDFIEFSDHNKIGIFLCDVAGHGVAAAFITSMIKSIILQAGYIKEDPGNLLFYINKILFNHMGGYFCTAVYCIYDIENRSIEYSIAGHDRPLIISDNLVQPLQGVRSIPLGVLNNQALLEKDKPYETSFMNLNPGTKLFFFTDGVSEARPVGSKALFVEEHMDEVLLNLKHKSSYEFCSELYDILVDYRKSDDFEDDVCFICVDIE